MTDKELIAEVVSLADRCEEENPLAAGVLFHLAGSITAGPDWLRRTFDITAQESARFVEGEAK